MDFAPSTRDKAPAILQLPFQRLRFSLLDVLSPREPRFLKPDMSPLQEMLLKDLDKNNHGILTFTRFEGKMMMEEDKCSLISFTVYSDDETSRVEWKGMYFRTDFMIQSCDGIEDFLTTEEISTNTESDSCLQCLSEWYMFCLQNHQQECGHGSSVESFRPTRLLDLNSLLVEGKVCLVNSDELKGECHYMTLSHCWGSVPLLRHTKLTGPKLRPAMPLEELPQTVRDAIVVVRHLNCQYIWIDSLCIVQDDPEDWNIEASQMYEVYSNAMCNIGATGSSNSSGGLFFE